LVESRHERLFFCITLCQARQHANSSHHRRLLSARGERRHPMPGNAEDKFDFFLSRMIFGLSRLTDRTMSAA
jgi:hypothetical protein